MDNSIILNEVSNQDPRMKIGYIRVSTRDQSLDVQLDAMKRAGVHRVFVEKRSGKNMKRPELQKALAFLRPGDTFVIWRLSRLGRSTKELIELAEDFESRNINLNCIREHVDLSTPDGRYQFRNKCSSAELEREIIVENTLDGLESARARGHVGGRPKIPAQKIETALKMYRSKEFKISEITEQTGICKNTLYNYVRAAKAAAQAELSQLQKE